MIARHFSVHYTTVDRVLTDDGVPLQYRRRRRSKLDPFLPFIRQTLAVWPKLPASRLYEMVRERGYARRRTEYGSLAGTAYRIGPPSACCPIVWPHG